MPEAFTIRRAVRQDEAALLHLWKDFLAEQTTFDRRFQMAGDAEERWQNDFPVLIKHERRRVFVAEQGGDLAGFITAQRWAPPPIYQLTSEVYVEEIYVRPELRDAHAGNRLLEAVKEWGNEIGANRLRLGALAENKEGAAFWERQGAQAFSITYTIELAGESETRPEKPKARLGF